MFKRIEDKIYIYFNNYSFKLIEKESRLKINYTFSNDFQKEKNVGIPNCCRSEKPPEK